MNNETDKKVFFSKHLIKLILTLIYSQISVQCLPWSYIDVGTGKITMNKTGVALVL